MILHAPSSNQSKVLPQTIRPLVPSSKPQASELKAASPGIGYNFSLPNLQLQVYSLSYRCHIRHFAHNFIVCPKFHSNWCSIQIGFLVAVKTMAPAKPSVDLSGVEREFPEWLPVCSISGTLLLIARVIVRPFGWWSQVYILSRRRRRHIHQVGRLSNSIPAEFWWLCCLVFTSTLIASSGIHYHLLNRLWNNGNTEKSLSKTVNEMASSTMVLASLSSGPLV